ncbi:MAG: 3-isopropylmalate dehydrogenase [Deltaproteobacteria bacterium RBG_13_49_15]|nr:MAG: 3-isopropylmalate dehydrogenase [Deltaproteobacteria bacterium RBG_13_49_15]
MKKTYHIGVIPGDGTGPEVSAEALKVLTAAAEKAGFEYELIHYPFGGERYLKCGETLPDSAVSEMERLNAILLGAIGHPDVKPGILEKEILLKLRFSLDLYINLRPVKLYPGVETPLKNKEPRHIDFDVVRENTEGLYAGAGGVLRKGTLHEVAIQESINTRKGVERCLKYAFERCRKRNGKKQLTLCGKTNVLTYAFDLWERVFHEVGSGYPDIATDYAHVDAVCMWMIKNPERFDVIVTDNMFGDIISDLGAMIQGGMGVAAGGNINPEGTAMFEPIGGSAPKYTGKNMINPLAAVIAVQMMLSHIGEEKGAFLIETSVLKVIHHHMKSMEAGKMGIGTREIGDRVASFIREDV